MSGNINVSWKDVENLVNNIANQMVDAKFNPDVIITVLRGGMVPARLLCNYFEKAIILTVTTELYDKDVDPQTSDGYARDMGYVMVSNPPVLKDEYKNVVILDDISHSGKTFQSVI